MRRWRSLLAVCALACPLAGCRSPYASDQLGLAGGLLGAGTGAIIGSHGGHAGEGALIGAAVGAAGGALAGSAIDNAEARNRAEIEARLGRPVPTGAVTIDDVVAMTRSGVPEEVIVSHIESRGMAQVITPNDTIILQQQGVSPRVQLAAQRIRGPVIVRGGPPPAVVVADPCFGPPCYYHPRRYCAPPPVVGFGFSYHHH